MSIAKHYLSGSVPTPDAAFLPTLNRVRLERGTPVRLVESKNSISKTFLQVISKSFFTVFQAGAPVFGRLRKL
jgi:hypothetical protein